MPPPLHLLRADVEDNEICRERRHPTTRFMEARDRILFHAGRLMAQHGAHGFTNTLMAEALNISTATLRRHFPDMDQLLATLIRLHLKALGDAIGEVQFGTPNACQKRRAAYLNFTRTAFGFTQGHLLTTRDRPLLPPHLREPLEAVRNAMAFMLGNEPPDILYTFLDGRCFGLDQIETWLETPMLPEAAPCPLPKAYAARKQARRSCQTTGRPIENAARAPPAMARVG